MSKVHVLSAQVTPRLRLTLVASAPIACGDVIVQGSADQIESKRTWRTVQIGHGQHLSNEFLDFVDHSCTPNALPDTERLALIALRDVAAGEPITFFYPGAEVELAQAFRCECGGDSCLGTIRGAFYLAPEQMRWTLAQGYCTAFMQRQLERLLGAAEPRRERAHRP
ncbi:MAG: SET domain-containing protein-lysine N-methyltransferase [Planctomycetota bacterium]